MNIAAIDQNKTMSSREIAELTGKQHKDVMRDIRKVVIQLVDAGEDVSGFVESTAKDKLNRDGRIFALNYSATMILISGYNPVIRSKIVNRWQELEQAQQPPALSEEEIVMQALAIQSKKVKALTSQVNELTPKANALDRIATADGSMNITNAAKHLQVRPKELFDQLSRMKWIYKRLGNKNWVGYQDKVQQGLLEHKVTTQIVEGVERIREQVRVTPKGMAKLSSLFEVNQQAA